MRGATLLGVLLAAVLLIAVGIAVRIYTQLDRAQRLEGEIVRAQEQLDHLIAIQLDQEGSLRGFLATGERTFLDPGLLDSGSYGSTLDNFRDATADLSVPGLPAAIADMGSVHLSWEQQVAQPLVARPHEHALQREILGKLFIEQLRGDTNRVHTQLDAQLLTTQNELKRRIDEALEAGLASVLVFGSVSIVYVTSRRHMLERIDRERTIVETLQTAFRSDLDVLPGTRVGTAYVSADQDAAVGGDLYDVRRLSGPRGLVAIADVSGKGIGAAVNTAFVKYTVRTLAYAHSDPAEILAAFNAMFLDTIADPNLFVVAFVGLYDCDAPALTYASAGHSGAYLRRGAEVSRLDVTGPVIGLEKPFDCASRRLELRRGDLLVLATDGLTEARDARGALLGDEGAMELLRRTPSDPQACADELIAAVRARSGGAVRDDLALLAIGIDGPANVS